MFAHLTQEQQGLLVMAAFAALALILFVIFWVRAKGRAAPQQTRAPQPRPTPAPQPAAQAPAQPQPRVQVPPAPQPTVASSPTSPAPNTRDELEEGRIWLLSHLTPREIRKIAARYQLKVTGYAKNWMMNRIICYLLCMFVAIPWGLVKADEWFGFISAFEEIRGPLFLLLWLAVDLLATWKLFLVNTPKLGATITLNLATGTMHVFVPGVGIRFPFEVFHYQTDDLSQRAQKVKKSSTFIISGIPMSFDWTAWVGPFLPLLPLNIRYDKEEAGTAATEVIENTISEETLGMPIGGTEEQPFITAEQMAQIQTGLLKAMEGRDGKEHHRDAFDSTIEMRLGATVEISTLGPPKPEKDFQQSLVVGKTVRRMKKLAQEMATELGMEGGEAMNNVMILNREEGVKKNIVEVQVGKRAADVAQHVGRVLGAAETIASKLPDANGGKNGGH